jgi:integrase
MGCRLVARIDTALRGDLPREPGYRTRRVRIHWHPLARWLSGPMKFTATVTRRDRKRRLRSGGDIVQTRYVVNFREPRSGKRKQLFFERFKDAVAMRDALVASVATDTYSQVHTDLTVAQVADYWLQSRRTEVKPVTWKSYQQGMSYVLGPLLVGSKRQRQDHTRGRTPEGAELIAMLGPTPVADLSTADIRNWHKTVSTQVSTYTANVAKKFLRAALALAAEDFQLRVPPMPSKLGRGRTRPKKAILTPDQVQLLLKAALQDQHKGIYYAFPFLTGVRPSEQLALLWKDVDLAGRELHIRRMQERDCSLTPLTKTVSGTRKIPISPLLHLLLTRWQQICPDQSPEARVFPSLGRPDLPHHKKRGEPLSYDNFRSNYWRLPFRTLGLPYVTPHSARHAFISNLQAMGIEVGLVAKLAGHANATVTLAHYTQAVRGGEVAINALERAYGGVGIEHGAPPLPDGAPASVSVGPTLVDGGDA